MRGDDAASAAGRREGKLPRDRLSTMLSLSMAEPNESLREASHEREPLSRDARAHLARALLDALSRREAPAAPELPSLEAARARRADDVVAARELALVHAHRATLEERVAIAIERDRAPVLLDDGSRLTLDEAERMLASKEERRVFTPLRRSLARAAEPFAKRQRGVEERFSAVLGEVLELPGDEVPSLEKARATLDRFLADLEDAAEEARAALTREGRAPLEDALALARGLDLPDPAAFSDEAVRRLGRALLEAGAPFRVREVKALRVPRGLAGLVIAADEGPVRAGACPSVGAGRFWALSSAVGAAVALSLFEARTLTAAVEEQALLVGTALALGASTAVVRQGVLEEGASDATRRARVLAASRLVLAQAAGIAARVQLDGEGRDSLREALGSVFEADPPADLLAELLAPPWPGLMELRGPAGAAGARVLRLALGSALALGLRDRYDEAFALVSTPYELFGAAREALLGGAVDALELAGARFDPEHPGRPLVEWSAELL